VLSNDALPPILIKLRAKQDGLLASIFMNDMKLPSMDQLRMRMFDHRRRHQEAPGGVAALQD
jgi:hypothetical protein